MKGTPEVKRVLSATPLQSRFGYVRGLQSRDREGAVTE
jgi:hypothetical protein